MGVVVGAVSDRPYATGTHLVTAAEFVEYALLAPAVVAARARRPRRSGSCSGRSSRWVGGPRRRRARAVRRARHSTPGRRRGSRPSSATTTSRPPARDARDRARRARASASAGRRPAARGRVRRRRARPRPLGLGRRRSRPRARAAALVVARRRSRSLADRPAARRGRRDRGRDASSASSRSAAATSPSSSASPACSRRRRRRARTSRRTRTGRCSRYIGLRVFPDHPIAGAGWQASQRVRDARAVPRRRAPRFPDVAAQAFPVAGRAATASRTPTCRRSPTSARSGSRSSSRRSRSRSPSERGSRCAGRRRSAPLWPGRLSCSRPVLDGAGARRRARRSTRSPGSASGSSPPGRRSRRWLSSRLGDGPARRGASRRAPPPPTPSGRRSPAGWSGRAPRRAGKRVLDVGCGVKPYYPFFAGAAEYVGVDVVENPARRPARAGRGASGRGRLLRPRPLQPGARALRRPGAGRPRAAPRDRAGRARARVHARGAGVPSLAERPLALDARGSRAALPRERRLGVRSRCDPGPGRPPASECCSPTPSSSSPAAPTLRPAVRPLVWGVNAARRGDRRPGRLAARADTRDGLRQLPRRRGGAVSRRSSSPAARASSARTSSAACSSAATRCACSTTSRPATAPNLDGVDVEVVEGELRSYERVHNAVRGVEVVFHLGALGSVPRSVQDPLTSSAVNVEGTLNVLLAARDEGVRRVVSRRRLVRLRLDPATLPATEATPPDPISPVRGREARGRALLRQLQPRLRALETVVLRYFNVFGPRQSPYLAVRGGRAALPDRDRARRADHDRRRRRAVARLHLRRERRRRDVRRGRRRRARTGASSTSPPARPRA